MFKDVKEIAKGLGTTLKVFFRPKVTVNYPNEPIRRRDRYHGRHELRMYEEGLEMCVGCELCQVVCPTMCITVVGAENDPAHPHSPGERYSYKYQLDMIRCIFCNYCAEACPTDALHLTKRYELSDFTRESEMYQKDWLQSRSPSAYSVPWNVYPPFEGREAVKN